MGREQEGWREGSSMAMGDLPDPVLPCTSAHRAEPGLGGVPFLTPHSLPGFFSSLHACAAFWSGGDGDELFSLVWSTPGYQGMVVPHTPPSPITKHPKMSTPMSSLLRGCREEVSRLRDHNGR